MALSEISWYYEEPAKTTRRLFDTFAYGKEYIARPDIKRALANLKLFPTASELGSLWAEIEDSLALRSRSPSDRIFFDMFREMRLSEPHTAHYRTTLNIVCEYIKFNCAYIHRGYITEDAIETALAREGQSEEFVSFVKAQLLQLSFNMQFKIVGLRELYAFMRDVIPNNWRQWICEGLLENVPVNSIVHELLDVGFSEDLIVSTIELLAREGMVSAFPSFLEKTFQSVIHIHQ